MTITNEPNPNEADDAPDVEAAGHSATAEEAMDAATDQEGHIEESAYTPTPRLLEEAGYVDDTTSGPED